MGLIVYTGESSVFNLRAPEKMTFYKNVPVYVKPTLVNYLPADCFSEYDPNKKYDIGKPILFKLPNNLIDILHSIESIKRVVENYPTTPIKLMVNPPVLSSVFNFIKLDRVEIINSIKIIIGQFHKEYNLNLVKDFFGLSSGALLKHCKEYAYLSYHNLLASKPNDVAKPTLIPNPFTQEDYIAFIEQGATIGSTFDLAKSLDGSILENYFTVKRINSSIPMSQNIETILKSKYVVSCGDNPLNYVAAYFGIPIFIFIKDNRTSHLIQLDKFNNIKEKSVIYTLFTDKAHSDIFYTLATKVIKDYIPVDDNLFPKISDSINESQPREVIQIGKKKGGRPKKNENERPSDNQTPT